MEERLKYLINQTEERIKLVDTKSSIIIAFFGILLSGNNYLRTIVTTFNINILYCYFIISLLFLSFIFLILTIRPVKKWAIFWDFKKKTTGNQVSQSGFWIENEKQADNFDINRITDFKNEFLNLFIELSKRRILKYRHYRISMWFLRLTIISLIPCLIYIFIKSF